MPRPEAGERRATAEPVKYRGGSTMSPTSAYGQNAAAQYGGTRKATPVRYQSANPVVDAQTGGGFGLLQKLKDALRQYYQGGNAQNIIDAQTGGAFALRSQLQQASQQNYQQNQALINAQTQGGAQLFANYQQQLMANGSNPVVNAQTQGGANLAAYNYANQYRPNTYSSQQYMPYIAGGAQGPKPKPPYYFGPGSMEQEYATRAYANAPIGIPTVPVDNTYYGGGYGGYGGGGGGGYVAPEADIPRWLYGMLNWRYR